MRETPHLADVAVPVGVSSTFTYLIPDDLLGRIKVGQRVGVPLGRRTTHGYVVRIHSGPGPERLRPIGPPSGGDEPVFDDHLLELTKWVSDYYLAPWGEVLEAAAPRGERASAAVQAKVPHGWLPATTATK